MSEGDLFFALLRISAIQALRAAGLTTAKPSVVDAYTGAFCALPRSRLTSTVQTDIHAVDILARYLHLLGSTTRSFAESAGRSTAELPDVRAALEHVGAIRPLNLYNDPEDEDTRGIENLIGWFRGGQAAEMRRVAGMEADVEVGGVGNGAAMAVGGVGAEWNGVIKKISEKLQAQT